MKSRHLFEPQWNDVEGARLAEHVSAWREEIAKLDDQPELRSILETRIALVESRPHIGCDPRTAQRAQLERLNAYERLFSETYTTALAEFMRVNRGDDPPEFSDNPWPLLLEHRANRLDARVPHASDRCGLCRLAETKTAAQLHRVRLRFGPLRQRTWTFGFREAFDPVYTYAVDPRGLHERLPPAVRAVPLGYVHEIEFVAIAPDVFERTDFADWLRAQRLSVKHEAIPEPISNVLEDQLRDFPELAARYLTDAADQPTIPSPPGTVSAETPHTLTRSPARLTGLARDIARLELRHAVLRFSLERLRPPAQEDWDQNESAWPTVAEVLAAYESFDELLEHAGVQDSRLAELRRERERAERAVEDIQQRLAGARERESEFRAEAERALTDIDRLRAQLSEAETRSGTLEAELAVAQRQLGDLEADLERARSELGVAATRHERDLHALQRRLEDAEARAAATPGPWTGRRVRDSEPSSSALEVAQPLYRLWLAVEEEPPADELIALCAGWMSVDDPERLEALRAPSQDGLHDVPAERGHKLSVETARTEQGDVFWRAQWRRPGFDDALTRFVSEATVCTRGDDRYVGVSVGVSRPGSAMRPFGLTFRAPRLPREILERYRVRDAGWVMTAAPHHVRDSSHAERLAAFLTDPARGRPVVYCSAGGPSSDALDPYRLARDLAGLAHVVVSGSSLLDDELREWLPSGFGTWGGAVRLLFPQLDDGADHDDHPLFGPGLIGSRGGGWLSYRLLRQLRELSVVSIAEPLAVRDVQRRAAREALMRAATMVAEPPTAEVAQEPGAVDRGDAEAAGDAIFDEEWIEDYERTLDALQASRDEATTLSSLVEDRDAVIEQQRVLIAELQRSRARPEARADPTTAEPPQTWAEVASRVGEITNGSLALTDRALEQLPGNPYPDPRRMWDHLARLAAAATVWREAGGAVGTSLKDFVYDVGGIEIALHDGALAQRRFEYDGVELCPEPHVKVDDYKNPAECGRIYFGIDKENLRWVVDHVGLHDYH